MLVSAVPDPSAFNADCFDNLYKIQAEDFLMGIENNGILILDSGKKLQDAFMRQIRSIPIKFGQRIQIQLEEILKNRKKRIIHWPVASNIATTNDLLKLAYEVKEDSKADALIIGDESLQILQSEQKNDSSVVLLSDYRNSDFEKLRQHYENQVGPIDLHPEKTIEELIIRAIRFTRLVRIYDPYIGKGENTIKFFKGIKYILDIWKKHGMFSQDRGTANVEIFTCSAEIVRDSDTDHVKDGKLERNQDAHSKVQRQLITRLENQFPWSIKCHIKNDSKRVFHARYLETQHAIIRIERGFDLFKQNGGFRRNFLTLNMADSPHLKECRDLPDADI